ncbi:hypothetical protein UY3_08337 [Chelonia mydas]|uniref:Uncharacterized protein n=1 Tax=Chelonia mydas TaxID=8469 RepID=M7BQY7_CHEMY|nr:hypothetical protein UY3_08337 [Chelonia mydas]
MVPTGTIGLATMLSATASAVVPVEPAVRVGWPGPSKDGYEWRPGWRNIYCCLWTGRSGGAGIYIGHRTAISTWRTGTNGNSCSVNSLDGQTHDGEMPVIDARGCNVLAETWSGSPSGNGINDRAMTDCSTPSETRTLGDAFRSLINIHSLRTSGAESPGPMETSQTVWSASIPLDSAPNGCWAVNGIGNIPLTKTGTGPEATAEIPVVACLWSMGPTSAALRAPAWT